MKVNRYKSLFCLRRWLLSVALFLFLIGIGSTSLLAQDYYVSPDGSDIAGDGSSGNPWRTIQHAINQVPAGATIYIMDDGVEGNDDYVENIDITKSLKILPSIFNSTVPRIKASNPSDHVFYVSADNVWIHGLQIYGATANGMAGIYLDNVNNCSIMGNTIGWDNSKYNDYGIMLVASSDNNIQMNTCNYNNWGITLVNSSYDTLKGNICSYNVNHGIELYNGSSYNIVDNNQCNYQNSYHGIYLWQGSNYNSITANECNNNGFDGILVNGSRYNHITGNTANSNTVDGIELYNVATNNTIFYNTCTNNSGYGIKIDGNSGGDWVALNQLEGNTQGNVNNASLTVNWNPSVKLGYCYNSQVSFKNYMGNYYDDYAGNDIDANGIGDNSYTTGGANDDYPLMEIPDNYIWQFWVLCRYQQLQQGDFGIEGYSQSIAPYGSKIWTSELPTQADIYFPPGDQIQGTSWTGQITFTTGLNTPGPQYFQIEIGYADDQSGNGFVATGPDVQLTGDGSSKEFAFACDEQAFTIPAGKYLAVRLNNQTSSTYTVQLGAAWTYISAPEGGQDYSLPVTLNFFRANVDGFYVNLSWQTSSELDNAGFHLYRRQGEGGEYVRITPEMIPGAGQSNTTQTYHYQDVLRASGTYYYRLESISTNGHRVVRGVVKVHFTLPYGEPPALNIPKTTNLFKNYPNPFNPGTHITFDLSKQEHVRLEVFNLLGQRVKVLADEHLSPGHYRYYWDGTNSEGKPMQSGIYFYRLKTESYQKVYKMMLTR